MVSPSSPFSHEKTLLKGKQGLLNTISIVCTRARTAPNLLGGRNGQWKMRVQIEEILSLNCSIDKSIPVSEDALSQDLRGHPVNEIDVGTTLGAVRLRLRGGTLPDAGAPATRALVGPAGAPLLLPQLPHYSINVATREMSLCIFNLCVGISNEGR